MNGFVENQLKELILDDDFTSLQGLANEEINLMDILRVSHKELQHSNFLAWLFDPYGTHGLGDFVFKEFIRIYFKENEFQNFGVEYGLSVFDFIHFDFDDLVIKREYKNIDLLFLSAKNKFCMVLENKIYASEGKGQLRKYRNIVDNLYKDYDYRIYIYLSFKDQIINEEDAQYYVQLNYLHIIRLLEQILNNSRLNLANKTKFVFEQYMGTLKSMLNQNREIEVITRELYKKYKSAFDIVFKYNILEENNEIARILEELIDKEQAVIAFKSNKTYIRFQLNFLYENINSLREHGLFNNSDDLKDSWIYLFEFNIRRNYVNFDLKIGQGDSQVRNKLYEIYTKNKKFFNNVSKGKFSPKWHLSFQKTILTEEEILNFMDDGDVEKVKEIIASRFRVLIDQDLQKYMEIMREAFAVSE